MSFPVSKDHYVIMLVDDQSIIAEAIRRMLSEFPEFDFHYCSEGALALENAVSLQPMVILQDLVMPDADGMELLKAYRNHPELNNTPVAVLSVKEDPVIKKQAFENGAYDYMVKLPDENEFIARIRHHAEACKSDRQLVEAMRALKESQAQTQRRNLQLEKLNEQKNRILGVAVHDLRNPLGNIMNMSEFLSEELAPSLKDDQKEMLDSIQELSRFTLTMVEEFLDVGTIESGELRLTLEPTNLSDLIHHNLEINTMLAHKKHIVLQLMPLPELPEIQLDRNKINQVLNNLIGNAIKYSHVNTSVRIMTERSGNFVKVSVTDQGQGIAEEDLSKLFKPYGQANVQTTNGEKNTGFGLAITRRIIEGHGGITGVESKPGRGSTFYFTLPVDLAPKDLEKEN